MDGARSVFAAAPPVCRSVVRAMRGSIRIGSVRGVAVWSVPLIMLSFACGPAGRTLPRYSPSLASATYAIAGVAGALLLLVSARTRKAVRSGAAQPAQGPAQTSAES